MLEEVRAAAFRQCRRAERAASLGLPWFRTEQKIRGRPLRVDKWVGFLYTLIGNNVEDWPEAETIAKTPPAWWRPGLPLSRHALFVEQLEVVVVFSDSPVTADSPVVEVSGSKASQVDVEADVVGVQTPPRKRRKTTLPSEPEAELVDAEAS